MQKAFISALFYLLVSYSFAQNQKKAVTYLNAQYNQTLYDATKGNNPWGLGIGMQTFLNNGSKFKPTIELSADVYLADDKVFRMHADGTAMKDLRGMLNLFAGASFFAKNNLNVSLVAGPSFINHQAYFGIKPALGFPITKSQKWMGKIAYINIFNRDNTTKEDFGSISLAIGLKLF
jgi:hypothetical protein